MAGADIADPIPDDLRDDERSVAFHLGHGRVFGSSKDQKNDKPDNQPHHHRSATPAHNLR
jgi:hypothetical protein